MCSYWNWSFYSLIPLVPLFLATVLGAGAYALGVVEGAAEATFHPLVCCPLSGLRKNGIYGNIMAFIKVVNGTIKIRDYRETKKDEYGGDVPCLNGVVLHSAECKYMIWLSSCE